MSYVELHACSGFSFLEGASQPEELAGISAEFGMPAMALLDRDCLSGAPRFHLASKKLSTCAHIGAEITAADGTRYPLLAESRAGYQNLCRLITRTKLRAKKGKAAAAPEDFTEFAEGLICLTGGEEGPLTQAIKNKRGRECAERLVSIFGKGRVYAELQRHLHRDEEARNQAVIEIAESLNLPLLATNGIRHARPEQRELLDVITSIRHKIPISAAGRLLSRNSERHIKTPEQMARLFADLPEAIANTAELSSRLQFTLADLGYEFPKYPVPPGETMNSFLRKRTDEGARRRYRPYHERARQQIERELALIEKLDLAGYFLIVWDLVEFCRQNNILVQGRGSAANSAVCYSLGITAVDPIKMELLFERFLSDERGEWPDIDLDLPSGDQRERVIQHVYQRYGKLGAAMTANIVTYRGRSAVRDIGKALGFPQEALGRLSKLVHGWEWRDPKDTPERNFREAGLDPGDPYIYKFLELYCGIQDLPRHLGQHSGGMVICQGQLDAIVPLEPATMPGRVVIQWDKEDCADMRIVKVDLLGLGMMAVLEDSVSLIRDNFSKRVDLAHLPQDDPDVYAALQKADTIGMFQVESRAQMSCLPRMKPKTFYDIVVQVAIIRPGPIVGKMMHPYLRRRQGREKPECLHPWLEPVLARTLGVPLFQEQLLRMAMIVAGFTGGQAEELRRAFGFKRSEARMADVEVKLREGMTRNGIVGQVQDTIIQSITSFALYGFPESHAASFALIAYASAWLKCHHLAAFTVATLNNQPMGFYSPATIVKDAQRHGLRVKPVHVNESGWLCSIEDRNTIRLGLNYVKGLRKDAGSAIECERAKCPFFSVDEFARRVPEVRREEVTKLAAIGALNFESHRRGALWQAGLRPQPSGSLLDAVEPDEAECPLACMTDVERLHVDFAGTGLTVGRHPMAYQREAVRQLGALPAAALSHCRNGALVRVAGGVIVRQRPGTAKGFVFLSMEDETGISNIIVRPDIFDKYRDVLVTEPFLLIYGVLQNLDGVVSVRAERVEALARAAAPLHSHDFH